ncbi:hypothetical protein BDZ88DRAFT_194635 [Geranomyces variabilis]|nr:hypothetical protein BDZ88DRAFT_194635 [Geranomyces variabilis]
MMETASRDVRGRFTRKKMPLAQQFANTDGAEFALGLLHGDARRARMAPSSLKNEDRACSLWEEWCRACGISGTWEIPSADEAKRFLAACVLSKDENGQLVHRWSYKTLKEKYKLIIAKMQRENRDAWAALPTSARHGLEQENIDALQAWRQKLRYNGFNRKREVLPIGENEHRLILAAAYERMKTTNSLSSRRGALRTAVFQALLHYTGARPSSVPLLQGYDPRPAEINASNAMLADAASLHRWIECRHGQPEVNNQRPRKSERCWPHQPDILKEYLDPRCIGIPNRPDPGHKRDGDKSWCAAACVVCS